MYEWNQPKGQTPIAVKTCIVIIKGREIHLYKGEEVPGLRAREIEYLRAHGFVR